MKTKLHICYKCVWGGEPSLGPACSLVGGSVFVSHHGPRLVDLVEFLLVSLTTPVQSVLSPTLPQDS